MKRIFVLYVVLSICAAAFSQIKFPEIKWKSDSLIFIREKEALRYGVETFGDGLYVDSLIHYLDTICHVEPQVDSSVSDSIFQAVWNNIHSLIGYVRRYIGVMIMIVNRKRNYAI